MGKTKIKSAVTKGISKTPVVMQLEALECGAASLAMVAAYYGKWVMLEQARSDCGVSRDGSTAINIVKAARNYGFDVKKYKRNPESIRKKGVFPCIIHWNFNHFVVLNGFKGRYAMINDPAKGAILVDEEEFDKALLNGAVELNNIYFKYAPNAPYILQNITLKIRPKEYVAVVGRTGCGKSTLIKLLLGLQLPERGAVYYGGKDLNTLDLSTLRSKIGTVMQNGELFQGTIFENITITAPKATLDDAWAAAETAGIANDIRDMPMGMHTLVSAGQGGISGGQNQRIFIERAIVGKPKILIFDEATSALDNLTQRQISSALDKMGCTRIVIAHRLSTIRHCDRILVIDKGSIAEEGSYKQLIANGGIFSELVKRQRADI